MGHVSAILVVILSASVVLIDGYGSGGSSSSDSLKVCFSDGCVRGRAVDGNIKSYDAFYGIPYAAPPVKELRFKKPVPVSKWRSTKDCTVPHPSCVLTSIFTGETEGVEDCLILNVYRPKTTRQDKPLPVVVFLHAGSFKFGTADPVFYGPDFVMDSQEVIAVVIQYRLGVFGFLSSGDRSCKGNFGLKDQILALKWVQRNIREFGGDPRQVTLSGFDAGAMSAQLLIMSEEANGLFHKAILMGAPALSPWALTKEPKSQFQQFAAIAGIRRPYSVDSSEIVEKLRKIPAYELQKFCGSMFQSFHKLYPIFRPTVEGDWRGAVIRDNPTYVWERGQFQHRPMLLVADGYADGVFVDLYYNVTQRRALLPNWEYQLSAATDIPEEAMDPIRDYYFDGEDPTEETFINFLPALRDILFYYPFYKTAQYYTQYANVKKNPVDLFLFNFTSTYSAAALFNDPENIDLAKGASYFDSYLYLFRWVYLDSVFKRGRAEAQAAKFVVQTFVDFAKHGVRYSDEIQRCTYKGMDDRLCDYLMLLRKEPNGIEVTHNSWFDMDSVRTLRAVERIASVLDQ